MNHSALKTTGDTAAGNGKNSVTGWKVRTFFTFISTAGHFFWYPKMLLRETMSMKPGKYSGLK
jgi:hypothetical protein